LGERKIFLNLLVDYQNLDKYWYLLKIFKKQRENTNTVHTKTQPDQTQT